MPIHISIKVNSTEIKDVVIGRLKGAADLESINTYLVYDKAYGVESGKRFTHTYGDGIDVCIAEGFKALSRI